MLTSICQSIPEWQSSVSEIAEIRSSVVCTLENVESVLRALLSGQFPSSHVSNVFAFFSLSFSQPSSLPPSDASSLASLVAACSLDVFGQPSFEPIDAQLRSIHRVLSQLLAQFAVNSLQALPVRLSSIAQRIASRGSTAAIASIAPIAPITANKTDKRIGVRSVRVDSAVRRSLFLSFQTFVLLFSLLFVQRGSNSARMARRFHAERRAVGSAAEQRYEPRRRSRPSRTG